VYRWCRRCSVVAFAFAVFGTVIAAVVIARIYTDSESVRQLVERFFPNFAPGVLDVRRAKYTLTGVLAADNVKWSQKDDEGVDRNILKGNVTIRHDPRELASGRIAVRTMTLADAELNFHFDKNGRCAAFKFKKAAGETTVHDPIAVDVAGATIKLTFESAAATALEFTGVAGRIDFEPNAKVGVDLRGKINDCSVVLLGDVDMKNKRADVRSLTIDGAPLGKLLASLPPSLKGTLPSGVFTLGKANLGGAATVAWRDDQPRIDGRISAAMVPGSGKSPVKSALLAGSFDAKTGVLRVNEASLEDADLAAALPLVPEQHRGKIANPESLHGLLKVSAQGTIRTKEKPFGWEGKATAELQHASWSPPQAPFPITGAAAIVEVTPAGLAVKKAEATIGPIKATASGLLPDWDAQRARMDFTASNVPLVKEIYDRLPAHERDLWDKFRPDGNVSISGEAAMNGGKPRFVGQVAVHNTEITYEKFPCRATNGQGCVEFRPDGRIEYDLVGTVGGGLVKLTGTLAELSPTAEMDLTITGQDVAIDDEIRRAFDPIKPAAEAIQKIHAAGKGKGVVRIRRRSGSRVVRLDADADLELRDFHADWFPYPFEQVTGKVVVQPDRVEFVDCVGTTKTGATVRMNGWSQRDEPMGDDDAPAGRSYLQLDFLAQNAPLDRTLYEALPADGRAAWDQLRPQGKLSMTARFVLAPGKQKSIKYRFDASKAAITPVSFPYRLHSFDGTILMGEDGGVVWKDLVAHHGNVEWQSPKGFIRTREGVGEIRFEKLTCPQLPIDDDLMAAVPPNLRSVLEFLSPSRPADRVETSDLNIRWSHGAAPTFQIGETKARFVNADLAPSIGAKNVTGEITLAGSCTDAPDFDGNIYLSSVTLAGMKATALQTGLRVRGPKIDFRGLQADFYGGKLHGVQLHAMTDPVPEYEARLQVIGASLQDYVRQTLNAEMPLNAEVSAKLRLCGRGASIGRLNGNGTLEMRQVDVLRLPILIDQLNFLLTKLPAGETFDQLQAEFRLDGPRMFVTNLKMSSPAGAFALQRQQGLIDLSSGQLNLDMVFELSRGIRLPPFTGLTAFHVGGTFANPQIHMQPGKGLKGILSGR